MTRGTTGDTNHSHSDYLDLAPFTGFDPDDTIIEPKSEPKRGGLESPRIFYVWQSACATQNFGTTGHVERLGHIEVPPICARILPFSYFYAHKTYPTDR